MKKVVISLLVVIMAMGTMGVAFTTGLDFTGNDVVMSQGSTQISQVNCDYMRFETPVHAPGGYGPCTGVWLSFDDGILQGGEITVWVRNEGGGFVATGFKTIMDPFGLAHWEYVYVPLFPSIMFDGFNAAEDVIIRVNGNSFPGSPGP